MLVLTRKEEEEIVVDGPCTIRVLKRNRNGDVKLGITGPAKVWRRELIDRDPTLMEATPDEGDVPAPPDERAA